MGYAVARQSGAGTERIGAGVFLTLLLVPIMRFRTKGLLRHIDRW